MNTEETLALLWKSEARLAAGETVERRLQSRLARRLAELPEDRLRLGLLQRFRALEREEPTSTERFSWADRERLHRPKSLDEAARILRHHEVKPIGRGHTGTPSRGQLLDLAALDRVGRVDDAHAHIDTARLIRAEAGITLGRLLGELQGDDLVPAQLGGSLDQSLAGAIHTGVHAPGKRPLADAVVSVDVLLDGELQRFEPSDGITDPLQAPHRLIQDDAAFAAMVVNHGQIGVSVAFTLVVEDLHFVEERTHTRKLGELERVLDQVRAGERIALTVRGERLWVHRYTDCRRHEVPQVAWSESQPLERRFLHALEDGLGPELLGWLVDLCPHLVTAWGERESRPSRRRARSWELETSPSTSAWRVTRESCALEALQERLSALASTTVHPIRVVFAEPSERQLLLPDVRTATIELRTPRHLPPPSTPEPPEAPVAFEAQRQLRSKAGDLLPETLVLQALQGDLPDASARRLQQLMQDAKGFERLLKRALPQTAGSRGLKRWEDWLGGNRRRVRREKVADLSDLYRVLTLRNDELIRAHGKHHADNWVSPPDDGSLSIELMEDWKDPPQTYLKTYQHQGETYARAYGWERLGNFFDRLKTKGLAVLNTGSFSGQSIAGPLSVATHGSGAAFGAMADGVVEIDILGADGRVRRIRRADWPKQVAPVDLPGIGNYFPVYVDIPFELAVVNLGCFGIVLSYVLQVTPTYRLRQKGTLHSLAAGLAQARAKLPVCRHVELLMVPQPVDIDGSSVQVALIDRCVPDPTEPDIPEPPLPFLARLVAGLGRWGQSQVGRIVQNVKLIRNQVFESSLTSQEGVFLEDWRTVLVRDTGIMAHSFEIHVPLDHLEAAADAVNAGIASAAAAGTRPTAPIGIRFVKAGTQAMAMNHDLLDGTPVDLWCTFEVPRLLGSKRHEVIVEHILARLEADGIPFRPHWGQYFPPDLPVASRYPRLPDWLAARDLLDPSGAFFPHALKARLTLGRGAAERRRIPAGSASERRALVLLPSHAPPDGSWQQRFEQALRAGCAQRALPVPALVFVQTDDLFAGGRVDSSQVQQALLDSFGAGARYHLRRHGGHLDTLGRDEDWQPEHLARWLMDAELREQLRLRLYNALTELRPQVLFAYGTTSLVAYDTLTHAGTTARFPLDLVTLGSPVAHVGLRRLWGGTLPWPRQVKRWMNVWHREDPFFVGPIARQPVYDVELREPTDAPHAPATHLQAPTVVRGVLDVVLNDATPRRAPRLDARHHRRRARRALLVGIDKYLDPAFSDLDGSVNDVLAMSELLQTHYGYRAEDIRILTDERATTDALRDRLEWLLAGTTSLDQRVFYFSGHGTQLPAYNALEVIDRVDECLVTHDFDWNATDRAFVDDDFMELYSQLPHGARFTAIFDCCHAAGMSRAGGGQVRGIGLPEDVLHRIRRFVGGEWRIRATQPRDEAVRQPPRALAQGLIGAANGLRPRQRTRDTSPAVRGHSGPYLPVLLYAAQEQDLAYEYRDGRQVRGAFSWALTQTLARDPNPTYAHLLETVRRELEGAVGFQRPDLEGPAARLDREPSDRQGVFDL